MTVNQQPANIQCLLSFSVKKKEPYTGEGCVEMDIPWQLCRTIGPLLSQRFPLANAKAQPRGDFLVGIFLHILPIFDRNTTN